MLDITRWVAENCAYIMTNTKWNDFDCKLSKAWFHSLNALCERHRFPKTQKQFTCENKPDQDSDEYYIDPDSDEEYPDHHSQVFANTRNVKSKRRSLKNRRRSKGARRQRQNRRRQNRQRKNRQRQNRQRQNRRRRNGRS